MLVTKWFDGAALPEAEGNGEAINFDDMTTDECKLLAMDLTGHLSKRQHCVFNLHWGVTTGKPVTHDKIAMLLGVSHAEVDEIYNQSLVSLRQLAKGALKFVEAEQNNFVLPPNRPHAVN